MVGRHRQQVGKQSKGVAFVPFAPAAVLHLWTTISLLSSATLSGGLVFDLAVIALPGIWLYFVTRRKDKGDGPGRPVRVLPHFYLACLLSVLLALASRPFLVL